MKAKPTNIDADLQYICPKCKGEYWIRKIEAMTPGFMIVCECSHIIRIEQVKNIIPVYSSDEKISDIYYNVPTSDVDNVKKVLRKYGYKTKEIDKMLENAGQCSSEEELLKKALEYYYDK